MRDLTEAIANSLHFGGWGQRSATDECLPYPDLADCPQAEAHEEAAQAIVAALPAEVTEDHALGAAFRRALAARPDGWDFMSLWFGVGMWHAKTMVEDEFGLELYRLTVGGPTPTAALDALSEALAAKAADRG